MSTAPTSAAEVLSREILERGVRLKTRTTSTAVIETEEETQISRSITGRNVVVSHRMGPGGSLRVALIVRPAEARLIAEMMIREADAIEAEAGFAPDQDRRA